MKRFLFAMLALAAMGASAKADTFTLNATSSYAGFYSEFGSFGATFDMTPDFVITNVNAGGGIDGVDNLFGTMFAVDQFTFDQATFHQSTGGDFITFTSSTQPNNRATMDLTPIPPVVIAVVNNTSYVSVYTVTSGTVQDATYLWDYFSGDVKDEVTGAPIATGVPEPDTWAMMLLGFAGLGFAFRQSRRKMSFA